MKNKEHKSPFSSFSVIIDQQLCILCYECVHGCPEEAITYSSDSLLWDSALCREALNCIEICPTGAIQLHHLDC